MTYSAYRTTHSINIVLNKIRTKYTNLAKKEVKKKTTQPNKCKKRKGKRL